MKVLRLVSTVVVLAFSVTSAFAESAPALRGLTHGVATESIIKGETTKAEIVQLFGAPNIITVSKKGGEK